MNYNDKIIEHDVRIGAVEDDIKEIKESIKEINTKLNGYLDKKIETKVKSMLGGWFLKLFLSIVGSGSFFSFVVWLIARYAGGN